MSAPLASAGRTTMPTTAATITALRPLVTPHMPGLGSNGLCCFPLQQTCLNNVEASIDGSQIEERVPQPLGQEPCSHGGAGAVQRVQQGSFFPSPAGPHHLQVVASSGV